MVNNMLDQSIRVFLITEEPAVLLITEGTIGTKGVVAMTMTTEEAAGMGEVMIEIDAIDAADQGAEATAVAVAEVPVLNIGAVVEAVPEIDLDVIVTPGAVLRIVIRIDMLLTEWVRHQECSNLLRRHRLVVQICQ